MKSRINPSAVSRVSFATGRAPVVSSFKSARTPIFASNYATGQEQRLSETRPQSRSPARQRSMDPFDMLFSDFPSTRGLMEMDFPTFPAVWDLDTSRTATKWRPKVDIHETDKAVTITAEVPGMKKEDIKVDLKEGTLSIRGETKLEKKEEEDKYTRIERSYGSFQRRIGLPDNIDASQIKAAYENGVLNITIPKTEKSEGTQSITIE